MHERLIGVGYDVCHNVVYFLIYLNCENYMKLFNYYGDVVGVYICYVHICCWWVFSYMILVLSCWCKHVLKYVGVDCWVIGPHTVDVGFHIHVGDEYYVFNYVGWLFGVIMMFSWHHGRRPWRWFGTTRV